MVLHHHGMIYANFHVPDPGIRFFVRLSGFSKSTYLEPACHGEYPESKNFHIYIYDELRKMSENDNFRTKPDPG